MGTLYLVATPIGNLEDMSYRAIRTLREVDYIAAEDTRHTIKLLNHYEIHKTMTSYHEHNKQQKGPDILKDLREGKDIALVTDAGTPGISDPGEDLVILCQEAGIPVTSIPGPVALINGLVLSGMDTRRFVYEGFLPVGKKERAERLKDLTNESRTMIFYEAPHRLKAFLNEVTAFFGGEREIVITRELTKKFEEVLKWKLIEAIDYYRSNDPRGEYVLIIAGCPKEQLKSKENVLYEALSLEDHLQHYLNQGMSKKEAIKAIAKDRDKPKRDIYQYFID
ncbi:16S rRNA (cytidine(1402)-2'-O)-methyltransferase [Petrocella sp. FN5]|uniref:16S rRNA (cytidine(1402)-2'-O)-methyltransferase n=1 Tax=Petrocella sp. FN5 TaxID=3032002 RepID=UPI0023DCCBBB|nr:16S rRNA (cytidine(1402)-2'-O)-methyltransferase [Petrocella sp. FN5]MDF1617584.1 16S rRNA (cytidine(1402)-2'-O)-methyltransferase [Petrocella sp. FN5]